MQVAAGSKLKDTASSPIFEELLHFSAQSVSRAFVKFYKNDHNPSLSPQSKDQSIDFIIKRWLQHYLDRGENLFTIGEVAVETGLDEVYCRDKNNKEDSRLFLIGLCVCSILYRSTKQDRKLAEILDYLDENCNSLPDNESTYSKLNPILQQDLLSTLRNHNLQQKIQSVLHQLLYRIAKKEVKNSLDVMLNLQMNSMSLLTSFLKDIGPQCTRSERALSDAVNQFNTSSSNDLTLTEQQAAEIIVFISLHANAGVGNSQNSEDELANALLNSITSNSGGAVNGNSWNIDNVAIYLLNRANALDGTKIAQIISAIPFRLQHLAQCAAFFKIYPGDFPQEILFDTYWENVEGQLSIFQFMVQLELSCYNVVLSKDEQETSNVIPTEVMAPRNNLGHKCFASSSFLSRLFTLSDPFPRVARDIFVVGLLSVPEIIMCALVRLQTIEQQLSRQKSPGGDKLKRDLFNEVVNHFFKYNNNGSGQQGIGFVQKYKQAFSRMYKINPHLYGTACVESYRACGSPNFSQAKYISLLLNIMPGTREREAVLTYDLDIGIQVGFVAADSDVISLSNWYVFGKFSEQ